MGFDLELARQTFEAFKNDFGKTANFLLENSQQGEPATEELRKKVNSLLNRPLSPEIQQKTQQAQELLSKISAEMPDDDEAYLDLNTDEDAFYINKYYSLLD